MNSRNDIFSLNKYSNLLLADGISSNSSIINNPNYGWYAGGNNGSNVYLSLVDRITYATDTNTASVRGNLSTIRYYHAAAGNATDGWHTGGYIGSGPSSVDRITYATDTNTASVRGNLYIARYNHAAT
jgi:hypothetical protein